MEDSPKLRSFVGVESELGVDEKRVQHSQIGVFELLVIVVNFSSAQRREDRSETHPLALLAQIAQLADENVHEDAEIVRVEVLLCARGGEEEVEDLENEERDAEGVGGAVWRAAEMISSAFQSTMRKQENSLARLRIKMMFSPKVLLSPSLFLKHSSTKLAPSTPWLSLFFPFPCSIFGKIGGGSLPSPPPSFGSSPEADGREATMNCSLRAMISLMRV